MKLWIWSDLHLEMQNVSLPSMAPNGIDAIVCAGDLSHACDLERHAREIVTRYGVPLIFVPGNHEFYSRDSRPRTMLSDQLAMQVAAEASLSWRQRLYVLDEGVIEIGGVRFVGGTLWTDFRMHLLDEADLPRRMRAAVTQLADFSMIRFGDGERLTPQAMLDFHRLTRAFIAHQLAVPFEGKTVVVTHHLPHPECTPAFYRGLEANHLFACSEHAFEAILRSEIAPTLWICGHTHHVSDVQVGRTRIVSNPYGYYRVPNERDNGFRPDLVIDTEALS